MISVSERRMFCLIWLFGGGGMGDADEAECGGLDEEWPEGAEETGDDGTLEDDWLSDAASFCSGCFLGIVKLDFVTLSAPVTWMGPRGKGDGGWTVDWPGFLDFTAILFGGDTGFLDDFELECGWEGFLSFEETFADRVIGAFFFTLTGVAGAGEGFSGGFSVSASFFCSFSLCFSSLGGAGNKEHILKNVI